MKPSERVKGYQIKVVQRPPRFKVDKSSSITFDTGELNNTDKMFLLENEGLLGILKFIPENIQEESIKKITNEFQEKSPSKRLYSVLFVYWKQKSEDGDFEVFYKSQMEKIIEHYKTKLI